MKILERGVCRLSVVPVRKESKDVAEQVTQLVFGDHYSITKKSKNGKWLCIENAFDGYVGWIDAKQHHPISEEYFDQINMSVYKVSLELVSSILYKKKPLHIVLGSILPLSNNELFKMEEQLAFNGESKSLGQKREFEFVKKIAKMYLGAPYQWGGRSPFGIDCSGFSQMVYKICGYSLPRDASQQELQGHAVHYSERLPGDLAFFGEPGAITHVGIVLEDSDIIHASGVVKIELLNADGIWDGNSTTHPLVSIKRFLVDG